MKRFPGIGDSGADRVLVFCDLDVRPSMDSNGLRVLVRLGLVPLTTSYAATYRRPWRRSRNIPHEDVNG